MAEPWTEADAEFFRHWLSECIKRSSHAGTAAFLRRAAAEIERLEEERRRLRLLIKPIVTEGEIRTSEVNGVEFVGGIRPEDFESLKEAHNRG